MERWDRWVAFMEDDRSGNKACSIEALMTVIKRHKIKVVGGNYSITDEMIAEAIAIDEKYGRASKAVEFLKSFESHPEEFESVPFGELDHG